jgi:type II secretory pathway component PulF
MSDEPIDAQLVEEDAHGHLSAVEAEELLRRVADLTRSRLDLPGGLRAAAQDCSQPRLASAMLAVADDLGAGQPPEVVLSSARLRLPSSLAGLIAAAVRSGHCGLVLGELLDLKEKLADVRREVRSALAYPLLMLAATAATSLLILSMVVPTFGQLFTEFELPLPASTQSLLWFSASGQWLLLGWLGIFALLAIAARFFLPWPLWCRIRGAIPVVGPIFLWSAAAEFARLVSLLLEHGLPLPQAIRMAADSASDGEISVAARRAAAALEQGASPAAVFEQESQIFPLTFVPYLRLGERSGEMAVSLAALSEMLLERIRSRANVIRSLAPPSVFLWIAVLGIGLPLALYTPMLALIQGLSGGGPSRGGGGGGGALAITIAPRLMHLVVLLFPLLALMLGRRLLFRGQRGMGRSALESAFYLLEWRMLLVVVLFAFLGCLHWGMLIPLAVVALVALAISYFRFLRLERLSLLTSLAIASDRGVPLHEVALSCAEDLKGSLQRRTLRLAEFLRQGYPLSAALDAAGIRISHDVKFEILAAQATHQLGPALRAAALDNSARTENATVTARLTYLVWVFPVMLGIVTFLMLSIVPVFAKMFDEFDLPLPATSVLLVNVANFLVQKWPLIVLLLFPVMVGVLLLDTYFFSAAAFIAPPLEFLRLRRHGTIVLRGLAAMARQQRPLGEALWLAASHYPARIVASRLEKVYNDFQLGLPWQESLRKLGFVSAYDAAVLQAAERAGNLAWALSDIADSMERRLTLRTRMLVNVVFPVLVLLIGAVVFFIVVGMFLPLIALIQGLAGRT